MQRYSQNRESILACLKSTKTHPSAEWIYRQLKPQYPHLSLATVYRNLKQLEANGEIRSMGMVQGQERFDGCTAPHAHMVCAQCGKLIDLPDVTLPEEMTDRVSAATGFTVFSGDVQLSGLCPDCQKNRS